ncbi:MAG: XVIPCD domain-containing protein [Luteimonas sp.]
MNEIGDARRVVGYWHLGKTSAHYESSGKGAGTISSGKGDHGGVSYGTYQLSAKMGTLNEYLQQSRYGKLFEGLIAGTPAFDAKWRTLAKTDPGFAQDQHDFIGRSHYEEQLSRLNAAGIGLSNRGRAVQDAVWSTSVQFRGLTPKIFAGGLAEKFGRDFQLATLTDSQIVEAVQDYKIAHNASLFKSSPEWQSGLLKRANDERKALLKLAAHEQAAGLAYERPSIAEQKVENRSEEHNVPSTSRTGGQSAIEALRAVQRDLHQLGYRGAHDRILSPDGVSGPNTTHAIKSFQRAHHLRADGIVGPRTLAALEEAKRYPLLSEATNPHHELYVQVVAGIHRLKHDAQRNDRELDNVAVALTLSSVTSGLKQVEHVVLGRDGVNLFAVQGSLDDPSHRRTHVELAHAASWEVDRPVEMAQSLAEQKRVMASVQGADYAYTMSGP